MNVGDNVQVVVEGSKILIEVDAEHNLGLSKSKKMHMVGTTHGFRSITVGNSSVSISLNVCTPNEDYVPPPKTA